MQPQRLDAGITRRRRRPARHSTLAALVAAPLLLAPAAAQQDPDPANLQDRASSQFEELVERMRKLQLLLAEVEPETAGVLDSARRYAAEETILDKMRTVRTQIAQERYDAALQGIERVRADIQGLIDLLLDRGLDIEDLEARIEALEGFRSRVDDLLAKQRQAREDAARAEDLRRQLDAIQKAKDDLARITAKQSELEATTRGRPGGEPTDDLAERQKALEKDARALADELEKIDAEAERLGNDGEPGGERGEPGPDDPKPAEPRSGAAEGARPSTPGSEGSCPCSGAGKAAADAMQQSGQKLQAGQPGPSLKDQQEALDRLAEARRELEKLEEEAQRELLQLPFDRMGKEQEDLALETGKLAEDMQDGDEPSDDAPEKNPGARNVQQAVPKQKAAAGMLKERKPGDGKRDQEDAERELEEAKEKLEDALAQLRQQLQDEILRSLEERFTAMLTTQKQLTALTTAADRLRTQLQATTAGGDDVVPAAVVTRCAELATQETALASDAADAVKLLEEDGTSPLFIELTGELRDDLERVADRLAGNLTGRATQAMQAAAEDTLRMLIDALRKQIEEGGQGSSQGGGDGGAPPLVPMSAEFRLLLIKQETVNARTKEFDARVGAADRDAEWARTEAEEIAAKQRRVEELTRLLAQRLDKEASEARDR